MKLSVAAAALAFAAKAAAEVHQLPDLSALAGAVPGGIPKATPEQIEKAKKAFNYFYPECSHECAAGAMSAAGFSAEAKNPSALCRATFHDDFLTCAKSKCSAKLYSRMASALKTACYLNTPQCAISCAFPLPEGGLAGLGGLGGLGGAAAEAGDAGRRLRVIRDTPDEKPECQPFDFACTCTDSYAKWYQGCLSTACENKEDVQHELNTGLALCSTIPPKCTAECNKSALAAAKCSPLKDPECACSPKVESAFSSCVATADCPVEEKGKAIKQFQSNCQLVGSILNGLPEVPTALQEMGLPVPPNFPTSVPELKDSIEQIQSGIEALVGGLSGGDDANDSDSDKDSKK